MRDLASFYAGKSVFITGHTGFKGTWLCALLRVLGAKVTGYALEAEADGLFHLGALKSSLHSVEGDVRDFAQLRETLCSARPEIVFHLAAQPLVKTSYEAPVYTYETNVMGSVHLLEAVRQCPSVRAVVNVTTDKVYENREVAEGYVEEDRLDGFEPYASSKSCSELVTASYRRSYFADGSVSISTARAGNVIGGGDVARDRIVPDCVRSALEKKPIRLRNPHSVRPYQHVLEPLYAYLLLAMRQCEDGRLAGAYNIGPNPEDCVRTAQIAQYFCAAWGEGLTWEHGAEPDAVHEAGLLYLNTDKLRTVLGFQPIWDIKTAVEQTVTFAKKQRDGVDLMTLMEQQIRAYLAIQAKVESE